MASVTLVESAKLALNDLAKGVIENVITVDQFFQLLPFDGIDGNALAYNRENALGAVERTGVGTTITTGKNAATFTAVTSSLTTIIGDAEVNGLIQATRSKENDQTAIQVASKAKSCGRDYQNQLINGTGAANAFTGLLSLLPAGQTIAHNAALSFAVLDQLLDTVTDKDGQVDWIMMPARTIRALKALARAATGASATEVLSLPSGQTILGYSGVPVFRNDWIPVNQTAGSLTNCTTILAGTLDDGTRSHGIAGLTAATNAGIDIEFVGVHQSRDEKIYRVKWYCGLALFSALGIAGATGVTN